VNNAGGCRSDLAECVNMGHNVMAALLLFHCSNSQIIVSDLQVCLHLFNRIVGDSETEPEEVQSQYNCILERMGRKEGLMGK